MIGCCKSSHRCGDSADNRYSDSDPCHEAFHNRRQAVIGIHEQFQSIKEGIDQSGKHIAHCLLDISPGIGIL